MRNTKIDAQSVEHVTDTNFTPTPEMKESIEKQKLEDKFVFQLISAIDGKRSDPFVTNWDDLRKVFNHVESDINPDDWVLLVAILNGKETIVPSTPLITVKSFLAAANNTHTGNQK